MFRYWLKAASKLHRTSAKFCRNFVSRRTETSTKTANCTRQTLKGDENIFVFVLQLSSHGMCENMYDVRYTVPDQTSRIKEMKVSKTLNLNNCTTKPRRLFTNVPGVRCVNKNCTTIDEVGPTKDTYYRRRFSGEEICLFVSLLVLLLEGWGVARAWKNWFVQSSSNPLLSSPLLVRFRPSKYQK